ncbi:aldose 1-epimerase family protein [Mucilaginibacter gynuensis]|uniref:Aldose 1-epimerase family protein n=1 Tax=Mucilaginibacter gynuensis TaxID=1302236 RepID=A0ABP8GVL3_9SPHI
MITIENESLKVTMRTKGAELTSIYNKITGTEQLWQADPAVWAWHAPNLFPIVGGVLNDELLVDGKTYPMPKHGFGRHSEYILLESSDVHAVFSLPNSEHTLQAYPYKFDFQVIYTLIDNALRVTYKVINHDDKTIHFSVGGHPAFRVPFLEGEKYEDYYVEFETEEPLTRHLISKNGYFDGRTESVPMKGNRIYLTGDIFNDDALIFKNISSKLVSIKSDNHDKSISVEFPHFNHLGIWAKPKANFVCIEPWLGYTDTEGEPHDISKKDAIQHLKLGHTFEAAFFISI